MGPGVPVFTSMVFRRLMGICSCREKRSVTAGPIFSPGPTVVQPDVTVTCDRTKLTEQGIAGPPDLVIEIVSPDSGLIDRRRKFDLYERFGVTE